MPAENYLNWAIRNTRTCFWNDSGDPRELDSAIERGAVGVTTNPFLSNIALSNNRAIWAREIQAALAANTPQERAESLMRIVVTAAAAKFKPEHERSEGKQGWVCAQVNPAHAGDRARMTETAQRFNKWAPNIAIKLPATGAGLDVLEDCVAEGMTVTATVSFTLPQVLSIAQRHDQGIRRAREKGIKPGRDFAVLMVGRLDDYLRDIAEDSRLDLKPAEMQQAGLAVAKRAAAMFAQRGHEAVLMVAALRGTYHMTELAGAPVVMSIAPAFQGPLSSPDLPREQGFAREIAPEVIRRLSRMEEFVKAYEPEGMKPEQFISYGLTQRTLAQFADSGWKLLESFKA